MRTVTEHSENFIESCHTIYSCSCFREEGVVQRERLHLSEAMPTSLDQCRQGSRVRAKTYVRRVGLGSCVQNDPGWSRAELPGKGFYAKTGALRDSLFPCLVKAPRQTQGTGKDP